MRLVRLICCAFVALTLSQFALVTGVRAHVRHTVIAASAEAAPAGGNYRLGRFAASSTAVVSSDINKESDQ